MKVVIDISPLHTGHKARGIGVYTRELTRALKAVDRANTYVLTTRPREVKNVNLIHYPYFDLFFHTLPLTHQLPLVVTIHDVIPLIFPEYFKAGIRGRLRLWLQRQALKRVNAIITDSRNSKADIARYLSMPDSKITTIPLAAPAGFLHPPSLRHLKKVRRKYKLPDQFLLYVGDINPHKNLILLLQAFAQITKIHPRLRLILVSRALAQPIPETQTIKSALTSLQLNQSVKILTTVPLDPPTDLHSLYQLSFAYIHPSLYEGFGLPVLEAMTAGTLVISSDAASLPEIYAQSAITINPHQITSIVQGINRALQLTRPERQQFIAAGQSQAEKFTWRHTALETIKVYQQVLYG